MTNTSNNGNGKLLYDAYNIYYEKGMSAMEDKNYAVAARNLYNASETLYKLAKESKGVLKDTRLQRADEIYKIAVEIEKKSHAPITHISAKDDLSRFNIKAESSKGKGNNDDDTLTSFTPVHDTGVSMDDVAGLEEAKQEITQKVIEPNRHPEIFKRYNKSKGGGILLYGVPGTGKTMLAQAIAHEIDAQFFTIKCSDVLSKWFGDAEQNIRNLFLEARKYPTSIIFFDEFEALGAKRDTNSTVMRRVVPELLAQIQGFEKNENNLIVIAATNRPWDIDTAFLRPGRFDRSIYVPLPDEEARKAIIVNKLKTVPCADNLDINHIVEVTNGFNGADVANFCEKLKDLAIARELKTELSSRITNEDVEAASHMVYSSVFVEDLKKCAKYQEEHGGAN